MNFSEEQILSMAPDESSKKSGKELANESKWVKREVSERALWGECQGSGKLPYQTQVDLINVAFKCSCPSRKFPCKHGLGLLLLYARDKKIFSSATEPDWVTGWLDKRGERDEKKLEKKEKEKKIDPASQAKRQENRLKRVEDGMMDLRLWIKDIVRNGLLNIPGKDSSYFETIAKRMVDAQAPGLATMIRSLQGTNFYQEGWQTNFLDQLLRIYLVLEGFPRMSNLSGALQEELMTLVGFTQSQEEIKAEAGVRDDWFVLAKRVDKEENLTKERNWLYGQKSKRYGLILQFYVKGQLPEVNLLPGSCVDAELVYFKGANPLRALVKEQFSVTSETSIEGLKNWKEISEYASRVHAVNPWMNHLPAIVENVVPVITNNQWLLKDEHGNGVIIDHGFQNSWKLMSLSGGKPLRIFAVGRENNFEPLGAWIDNQYKLLV
ncbi:SWIM zinc finger family protein [Chryseolinea sp. H1M3-3]|uniref:SWIM zinc finger family protein n=1 Tax=Chryseolinea sp. H1M3-3 TaxID=3034144 RepID=UPI0023EA9A4E|nr:SWIM zinc finger family protein [Chryseolinea sp. H1M3-3]